MTILFYHKIEDVELQFIYINIPQGKVKNVPSSQYFVLIVPKVKCISCVTKYFIVKHDTTNQHR